MLFEYPQLGGSSVQQEWHGRKLTKFLLKVIQVDSGHCRFGGEGGAFTRDTLYIREYIGSLQAEFNRSGYFTLSDPPIV